MTRQYIGARYVPIFFDQNNGVWLANTSYEALTIVQYMSNSYTSKKPVPANVGNPAENSEYWVCTGNYNAQVEEYKEEVEEYKEEVKEYKEEVKEYKEEVSILTDKGITLLIGDSYGEGYTPNGYVKSWIEFVKEMRDGEYKSSAIGGSGFLAGNTFTQQLRNLYNEMSDKERIRVRKIVVAGGFNDTSFESEQLANAVHIFGNTCRDLFPFVNDVYCCVIGWSDRADFRTGIYNNIMPAYNKGSSLGKMTYVGNCAYELHDYRRMSSDNIHPNVSGYEALGRAICEVLECGNYHTIFGWRDLNANITYGTPSLSPLGASIVDDVTTITWLPLDIVTDNITVSGGEWIEIGNFDTNILNGYNLNTPFCTLNATCYLLDTYEHYYTASAKIGIYAGKIYLMINEVQPNGAGWFRLDNTKKIMIDACTTSIASYLC